MLQGARLTAWELMQRGIDATLICDSMAAQVMREGRVQAVITGADRIAANGDTANKIGTYGVALLAAAHGIPFYIAAPISTFDLTISSGAEIPIEQRDSPRNHPRLRPRDGAARRASLQPGFRRDAGPADQGHHLRAGHHRAGHLRSDRECDRGGVTNRALVALLLTLASRSVRIDPQSGVKTGPAAP